MTLSFERYCRNYSLAYLTSKFDGFFVVLWRSIKDHRFTLYHHEDRNLVDYVWAIKDPWEFKITIVNILWELQLYVLRSFLSFFSYPLKYHLTFRGKSIFDYIFKSIKQVQIVDFVVKNLSWWINIFLFFVLFLFFLFVYKSADCERKSKCNVNWHL